MKLFETQRQIMHALFGIAIAVLLFYGILNAYLLFMLIILSVLVSFYVRKRTFFGISWFLKHFERDKDLALFPGKGLIYYLIGCFLVVSLFPEDIALPSILVLALCDSVAPLFGLHFGKIKHPFSDTKNLEGMLAGFVAGFFGAIIFLSWQEAFVASFAAMLIEGIDVMVGEHKLDDNVLIPIIAALAIVLVRMF